MHLIYPKKWHNSRNRTRLDELQTNHFRKCKSEQVILNEYFLSWGKYYPLKHMSKNRWLFVERLRSQWQTLLNQHVVKRDTQKISFLTRLSLHYHWNSFFLIIFFFMSQLVDYLSYFVYIIPIILLSFI